MNYDYDTLVPKLKRHNIKCKKEGTRIYIGGSKIDLLTLFGLVLLPFAGGIILISFYLFAFQDSSLVSNNTFKFILGIIFFMGTSLFYFKRIWSKYQSNKTPKILFNYSLKIKDVSLSSSNIQYLSHEIVELKDEHRGRLFVTDNDANEYLFLEIDGDEGLLRDDLTWIQYYLHSYLQLQ